MIDIMEKDYWTPLKDEFNAYYQGYISKIYDKNVPDLFEKQMRMYLAFFGALGEDRASLPYAPGKWTFKQLLGHIIDTEKIMHFRALCIARQPGVALPGFHQDNYVQMADFQQCTITELLGSFESHRLSLGQFMQTLSEEELIRQGKLEGHSMSVRAACCIVVGHAAHHMQMIQKPV
jgi:hypothetical protein